ncbi:MAG: GNAT family N-acetyltransferase [Acidimicrobiales bacterium]
MQIRAACDEDIEQITEIYNREVTDSLVTLDLVPWTDQEARGWLDRHKGAHPALVALGDRPGVHVVGFAALSAFKDRPGYSTTVENSLYVREGNRRQGVGRALLGELVEMGARHGFHAVIARMVRSNRASIALHESCGFQVVGVEHEVARKQGRWVDVLEMERLL